jgi:hypothetical protein
MTSTHCWLASVEVQNSQSASTNRSSVSQGHARNGAAVLSLYFNQSKASNRRLDVQPDRCTTDALRSHAQVTTRHSRLASAALARDHLASARGLWIVFEAVGVCLACRSGCEWRTCVVGVFVTARRRIRRGVTRWTPNGYLDAHSDWGHRYEYQCERECKSERDGECKHDREHVCGASVSARARCVSKLAKT